MQPNYETQSFEHIRLVDGGKPYFNLLRQLIASANKLIHLQLYRFDDDQTGQTIQSELIRAANRGVQVKIVIDGYGSSDVSEEFINTFKTNGIEISYFSPIRFNLKFRIGRRLHHKFIVIDGYKSLIGGVNIADKYHGSPTEPPWLDFAIYLEGKNSERLNLFAENILSKRIDLKAGRVLDLEVSKEDVRLLENDIVRRNLQIRRSYYEAIYHAKESITIVAAYFVPRYRLLKLLFNAAERGVEVKLVLPSVSDTYLYEMTVKHFYSRLLRHKIRIFEYKPAVLHAKVAVIDNKWSTVGSYNLNDLSDLLSTELNVEVRNSDFAEYFNQRLENIIDLETSEVEPSAYLKASFFNKLKWRFYYRIYIYSIRLLNLVTSRERRNFLE